MDNMWISCVYLISSNKFCVLYRKNCKLKGIKYLMSSINEVFHKYTEKRLTTSILFANLSATCKRFTNIIRRKIDDRIFRVGQLP